jgi:hypothetical protein
MMVRNYNLGTPTGILASGTGDTRKIYKNTDKGSAGNQTYVFTNTDKGYQFNASLQAVQTFKKGLYLQASYNYLVSKDASSISAEISSDAFDRNPILNNANEAINSNSLMEIRIDSCWQELSGGIMVKIKGMGLRSHSSPIG